MDKNTIKKFVVWARRELIAGVITRAGMCNITEDDYGETATTNAKGDMITDIESAQRNVFIDIHSNTKNNKVGAFISNTRN